MSSERNISSALSRGARAGAVAAAAVIGALLGFGLRAGTTARPLNAAAALLMGNRARGVWDFAADISLAGALVVIASCVIVGMLCGAVLQLAPVESRVRHPRLLAFALALVAAMVTLLTLVARAPDFVSASPIGALSITQGVVLSLVVSVAYASGMGLAR